MGKFKYEVYVEEPTLDSHRLNYSPRENYALSAMWPSCIVTGASGKRYYGIRESNAYVWGMSLNSYFYDLNEFNLDEPSPALYPELMTGNMEPFEYSESADEVHYVTDTVRFDCRNGESTTHSDANACSLEHYLVTGICSTGLTALSVNAFS